MGAKPKVRDRWRWWSVAATLAMITNAVLWVLMFNVNAQHCQAMAEANGRDGQIGYVFGTLGTTLVTFLVVAAQWSIAMNPEARSRSGVGDVLRTLFVLLVLALTIRGLAVTVTTSC